MSAIDRILGELTEFRRETLHKLEKLQDDVDSLKGFKIRVMALSSLVSIAVTLLFALLKK